VIGRPGQHADQVQRADERQERDVDESHGTLGEEPAGEQPFPPEAEIHQRMGDSGLEDTENAEQGDAGDD